MPITSFANFFGTAADCEMRCNPNYGFLSVISTFQLLCFLPKFFQLSQVRLVFVVGAEWAAVGSEALLDVVKTADELLVRGA